MHYTRKYEIESKMTPDDSLHSNLYLNVSSTTINVALFCLVSDVSLHYVHEYIQRFCTTLYFGFQTPNISSFRKRYSLHLRAIRIFGNISGKLNFMNFEQYSKCLVLNEGNMNQNLQKLAEICLLPWYSQ